MIGSTDNGQESVTPLNSMDPEPEIESIQLLDTSGEGSKPTGPESPRKILRRRTIASLKTDSKSITLTPKSTFEDPTQKVIPKNPGKPLEIYYFARNTTEVLHSTLNLLLLLLVRIGPTLLYEDNLVKSFFQELHLQTQWGDSIEMYISLTYWSTSIIALLFCLVVGSIILMTRSKLVDLQRWYHNQEKPDPVDKRRSYWLDVFERETRYPVFTFVLVSGILVICHALFMIGLHYRWSPLVISARLLFGSFDAVHQVLQIFLVVTEFPSANFVVSVGFIISMSSFGYALISFLYMFPNFWNFMYISLAMLIFSFFGSITYLYIDLKKHVFGKRFEDHDGWEEKVVETPGQGLCYWLNSFGCFTVLHQICIICLYLGIWIFPFYYGGIIWNRRYNGNNRDLTNLRVFEQIVFMVHAFCSPGFGALLDVEYGDQSEENIYIPPANRLFALIFRVYSKYKNHILLMTIGLFGSSLINYLLYYSGIYPATTSYYVFSILYGVFQAMCTTSIYSLPMIYIRKHQLQPQSLLYATYFSWMLLIINFSKLLNGHVFQSELIIQFPWYICNFTIFILSIACFLIGAYLLIYGLWFRVHKPVKLDEIIEKTPTYLKNIPILKDFHKNDPRWMLLVYLPMEIMVFVFSGVVAFCACGMLNFYLWGQFSFSFARDHSIELFFLPVIFGMCVISMFLAFPENAATIAGMIFFRRSRKVLGFEMSHTIADRLVNTSRLTVTTAYLQVKKPDIWKALANKHLTPKAALFVVPDQIYLENQDLRVQTFEDFSDDKLDGFQYKECYNGHLIINDEEIKKVEEQDHEIEPGSTKNVFSLELFKQPFFLFVFSAYCIFFMIPIFYRFVERINCVKNCQMNALLPHEDVFTLINVINFIFGFFILIPFVNVWLEISKILEGLAETTIKFDKQTRSVFGLDEDKDFPEISMEDLKKWDAKFTYLQEQVHAKSEFVKSIYLFAISMTKSLSVGFTMVALFVKLAFSPEPIRIAFVVFCLEFAVLRYVILPASIISSTMQNLVFWLVEKQKRYSKWAVYHERSRSLYDMAEQKRILQVMNYWDKILTHWYNVACVDRIGFRLQFRYVVTDWWISKSLMNTWVETFFLSVIPSTFTLFVKQLSALNNP